jgi:transcriptional regulator
MQPPSTDVLRGTLDLLILKTLTLEPMHGWGIGQRIQQLSRGVLDANQGSLYPAFQRLEQKGWIDSEWRTTENNRRAKYYRLTAAGRRAVGTEAASWRRYVEAVEFILQTT